MRLGFTSPRCGLCLLSPCATRLRPRSTPHGRDSLPIPGRLRWSSTSIGDLDRLAGTYSVIALSRIAMRGIVPFPQSRWPRPSQQLSVAGSWHSKNFCPRSDAAAAHAAKPPVTPVAISGTPSNIAPCLRLALCATAELYLNLLSDDHSSHRRITHRLSIQGTDPSWGSKQRAIVASTDARLETPC